MHELIAKLFTVSSDVFVVVLVISKTKRSFYSYEKHQHHTSSSKENQTSETRFLRIQSNSLYQFLFENGLMISSFIYFLLNTDFVYQKNSKMQKCKTSFANSSFQKYSI